MEASQDFCSSVVGLADGKADQHDDVGEGDGGVAAVGGGIVAGVGICKATRLWRP